MKYIGKTGAICALMVVLSFGLMACGPGQLLKKGDSSTLSGNEETVTTQEDPAKSVDAPRKRGNTRIALVNR